MKKRIIFYGVLSLPAVLMGIVVLVTALDIVQVRMIDQSTLYTGFRDHLLHKGPASFPLPEGIQERHPLKKTVFVFGESSLVLSDGKTFPDYLGSAHEGLQVVNFGVTGIDSLSVLQRVQEALAASVPDIMILYYGHNDYNNAYHGYLVPQYFERFNLLLRIPYLFYDKTRPVSAFSFGTFYWYGEMHRPRLYQLFEKAKLVDIHSASYAPVNGLILEYFMHHNEAIIRLAASRNVPVVLITPVGNLRAEPYGDLNATTGAYRKGMETADYQQSIAYLKQARDSEIFTYDVRAKSGLVDYIRHFKRSGVYVLDLEKELETKQFGFGYSDFLDYFHFNDRSHRLLADMIYDFLKQKNLVRPVRSISK